MNINDPNWALTSIIIADTWEWFPFTMLMVLAALQMMPQELLDAAKDMRAANSQPLAVPRELEKEPLPAYVVEPAYGPTCYYTRGRPVWDDYRGAWVRPRVRVCD